ncbi:Carboxypeptidase D [Paramuricea clavata]|uniref:Carboxypeptidase D n=1 Tax=Paramuricea clavata TaxID=317549 RepID=A0A7D9JQL0_PARCT|nr:Carboxypeptidase D [Paramuricea clavata]
MHKKSTPKFECMLAINDTIEATIILQEKLTKHIKDNPNIVKTPDILFAKLKFTEEEITTVNNITLKEWQCKEWYVQKAGFITASKCKQIYTSQGTIEKNTGKNIDVSSLVKNIVQPKIIHIKEQKQHHKEAQNARDWGVFHGHSLHNAYFRVERHKHHS